MKIFTINSGAVENGAKVDKLVLSQPGVTIAAILVGEKGRGRDLGTLPVADVEPDDRIDACELSQTKSGKPKLIPHANEAESQTCLVVFKTKIGFRGGNSHTGDRNGLHAVRSLLNPITDVSLEDAQHYCQEHEIHPDNIKPAGFLPFPGEIICRGSIAQGDAGAMGSGAQIIAVIPRNVVFRTGYSGRLYGAPSAHYYVFNGSKILAATWEERELTEIF